MAKKITAVERGLIGFYLDLLGVSHKLVRGHCERVGLYSAKVANRLHKDVKAAYLGGIFHDIGKALLDGELFSGRNVDAEEYKKIQQHAKLGHEALRKRMMFTSLCCGLHHAMGEGGGYGLKASDIPQGLSPRTVKKVLEISEIIAVCDFIDAATTRKTDFKDKAEGESNDLRAMLVKRFPESEVVVDTALDVILSKKKTAAAESSMEVTAMSEIKYRGVTYRKVSKLVESTGERFVVATSKSGKTMWKPTVSPSMVRTAEVDYVEKAEAKASSNGVGEKEQELVQYVDKGNLMSPAGKIILAPKLKAGVYQIVRTMQGLAFERQAISTDSLLRFEDPVHTEILAEMDKFWQQKDKFEKKGLLHNRAVLMYGPPGSGKSCIIKIATGDLVGQGDIVFVADRYIADLVDGLKVFREIEPTRRCLALMEDVDEMGEHSLLQLLDGTNTANNVLYLATTNYVDRLPPRVLRAGRFGRKIEVPYPPDAGRKAYLESKIGDEGLTPEALDDLVKKTSGFSFGSLKELVTAVFCMGQPLEKTLKRLRGLGLEGNESPKPYSDGDEG
jgi:putative nucleotidyltransferase with HDIG domain